MVTVTFGVYLKTGCLCDFLERIINALDFTPSKMDVYYNEFSAPKFFVNYNPQIIQQLSMTEVDGGITSFSLYDNKYSNENVTPFFRARILDTTFSNEQVVCILEWVSYPTLYFNPDIHFLSKYLRDNVKLIFLLAYDQFDVETKNVGFLKTLLHPQSRWRRRVMVNSMPFMAAPVMFFGKEYFSIIPKEILLKVPNSKVDMIQKQEVIAIKLFNLYDSPSLHRDAQKKYWKVTSLLRRIKDYQERVFLVDAVTQYKERYKKMKAQSLKRRKVK